MMSDMNNDNYNNNDDAVFQILATMCKQEEEGYRTCDYLYQSQELNASAMNGPLNVDADCRTKMAAWCFQVVDFCKFNRETVSIAMNLLDRYMATAASATAKADRKTYQLAAMTCLYTAVKIHEPEAMDPKLVSTMSRGTYTPEEVEGMELQILMALTWRVNPPTAMAFVRQFLQLIPESAMDQYTSDTVYDLAKFQTELAVSEYEFLNVKPSVVGYCSLMNALESIGADPVALRSMALSLAHAIQMNEHLQQVEEVQVWLYQAIVQEPAARDIFAQHAAPNKTTMSSLARQTSCEVSPRSIAA